MKIVIVDDDILVSSALKTIPAPDRMEKMPSGYMMNCCRMFF